MGRQEIGIKTATIHSLGRWQQAEKKEKTAFVRCKIQIKMRKLFIFILCLYSLNSFSQFSIKGKVQDTKQNPVDIFNVILISVEDSTNIIGGTFYEGVYSFDKLKKQKYFLKVTSLGYIEHKQIIETQDNSNKELTPITLKIKELKEVIVTAHRPKIVSKADRITVNIEGSTLGESRDGIEMLQRTPGIKSDGQGNISVIGKDNVIFYIDNKRVNSLDEVKLLNPQLVKSIEIIDNPSAVYDAEGHAVILIKTIKRQEKYYVQFESGINQSKRTTEWGNIETAFSGKSFTTSLYYDYTNSNSSNQEDNNSTLFDNQKSIITNTLSNNKTHTYRISTDFALDKKQSLSLQFDGYSSKSDGTRNGSTKFSDNGYSNFNTHMDQFGSFWGINGILNYSFDIDTLGQKLVVLSDFKYGNNNYGSNYYNFNAGDNVDNPFWNTIKNDNRPFVFSIKADYSKPINKHFSFDAGIKYSTVESNSRTDLTGSETLLQHYITTEKNLAMYAVFNAKLNKKFDINIGLRAENMKRNAQKEGVNYMDTTQLGFYPNVLASYNFSDDYSLGFSYSKRIKRPSFASLDPSIYKDSLFVRYGNPNLQSTDYHTFQLSLKLLKKIVATCFVQLYE